MNRMVNIYMLIVSIMFTHHVIASNNNGMMSTFAETDFPGMNGVVETNFTGQEGTEDNFNGIRTEIEPLHYSQASGMNGVMDVFDPQTDSIIESEMLIKQKVLAPPMKYSFYFDVNSAQLSSSDIQKIKDNASKYKNVKFESIVIFGFADPTGSDAYNVTLSTKRANALKNILMQIGFPENKLVVQGMGEESNSSDYAQSRRVEMIFTILQ